MTQEAVMARSKHRCICVATSFGLLLTLALGCSQFELPRQGVYQTLRDKPQEKADKAKSLNTKGLKALESGELSKAEEYFGAALAVDNDYGPAHNNLGQVYLKRRQLYLAAWEFELAANLMPTRPHALINLGLVYETAGQLERAMEYYEVAYDIASTDKNAIGSLARISVKLDHDAVRTRFLLQELMFHDDRADWVCWANDLFVVASI